MLSPPELGPPAPPPRKISGKSGAPEPELPFLPEKWGGGGRGEVFCDTSRLSGDSIVSV